jgi:hypothetical protein
MSKVEARAVTPVVGAKKESFSKISWKHFAPLVVAIVVALIPAPGGCRSTHGTTSRFLPA